MEKTILITNVEQKTAKNGNAYLQITDKDGAYSVFEQKDWEFCVQDKWVVLKGEQKGRYFNIDKDNGIRWGEPTQEEVKAVVQETQTKIGSIEAQVAAYCAKEIMVEIIKKTEKGLTLKSVVDSTTTLQAFILATMQGNFKTDFDMAKFLVSEEKQ